MPTAGRLLIAALIADGALLLGCAAQPPHTATLAARQSEASILVRSRPTAGSTAFAPIDELKLHFNPPARLDEVTLSGPAGVMPMMIHSVAEVADYSIPLSGLEAGAYTVTWKATAQGQPYQGSFGFQVK